MRSCGYAWSTAVGALCRTSTTVSSTPHQLEYSHPKHADAEMYYVIPVTGPLSELQIAYVCRETLQVRAFFTIYSSWDFQAEFSNLWGLLFRVWDTCTAWARCTETLRYPNLSLFWRIFHSYKKFDCKVSRRDVSTFLPGALFLPTQKRELESPQKRNRRLHSEPV